MVILEGFHSVSPLRTFTAPNLFFQSSKILSPNIESEICFQDYLDTEMYSRKSTSTTNGMLKRHSACLMCSCADRVRTDARSLAHWDMAIVIGHIFMCTWCRIVAESANRYTLEPSQSVIQPHTYGECEVGAPECELIRKNTQKCLSS